MKSVCRNHFGIENDIWHEKNKYDHYFCYFDQTQRFIFNNVYDFYERSHNIKVTYGTYQLKNSTEHFMLFFDFAIFCEYYIQNNIYTRAVSLNVHLN